MCAVEPQGWFSGVSREGHSMREPTTRDLGLRERETGTGTALWAWERDLN